MIAEIVFIDLPKGTTRTQALALYRKSGEHWRGNPDLIEKYYFFNEASSTGGGFYIWRDRNAAARWHGEDYKQRVLSQYGAPPRILTLDALLYVDPPRGVLQEFSSFEEAC